MAIAKRVATWRGQVRMPKPLIEWVQKRAKTNFRSVNAEIVEVIREGMQRENQSQSGESNNG